MSDQLRELEKALRREFEPEERYEIEQWQNGRALDHIRHFDGFEIVLSMLQSYALDSVNRLLATDPKETAEVAAAHAVAFSLHRLVTSFVHDVDAAIEASRRTPTPVSEAAKLVKTSAPVEML